MASPVCCILYLHALWHHEGYSQLKHIAASTFLAALGMRHQANSC